MKEMYYDNDRTKSLDMNKNIIEYWEVTYCTVLYCTVTCICGTVWYSNSDYEVIESAMNTVAT